MYKFNQDYVILIPTGREKNIIIPLISFDKLKMTATLNPQLSTINSAPYTLHSALSIKVLLVQYSPLFPYSVIRLFAR